MTRPLHRHVWPAIAVPALVLLHGCGGPAADPSLFPLDGGHAWTYQVTTRRDNDTVDRETLVLRTLGRGTLDDGPAWQRRSDDGVDYWLRVDDSGIYRVATKSDVQADPVRDPAPRYVLKAPYTVGTQWAASTTAYLLRRRQDFPPEVRHTHQPVPMNYTIEAVDDHVDTAAGRFERCVRVKGRAAMRLFADPVAGWRDMPLVTTEWYCPGVGLAKLVREEPAGSTFLAGGTLTMDLRSWQ